MAASRDWSLAELVRRGMELYVDTCPEIQVSEPDWVLPVLRPSGGMLRDPATLSIEADVVFERFMEATE